MDFFYGTWDWYIAGPIIGIFVPAMLLLANKLLGISSSFTHLCSIVIPKNKSGFLNYNSIKDGWKFYFIIGITIGAIISNNLLSNVAHDFLPASYATLGGMFKLFFGGFLVGFGTRYANGCTSGHSITGLSLLQFSSLAATLSFFAGGLFYTYILSTLI